ncbi:50S ribosomal protein L21 [Buchnera aphidicola (Ceratoglyphina bambusae)]|uniref:50S ribosomal protein L21 n=1 Tax=Buchnera aphidicola TaxID=9 RepID=UPI0031B84403
MKAVFIIKNKQYLAKIGDLINTEKLDYKIGEKVTFKEVIILSNNKNIKIGKPYLKKEFITASIQSQNKNKKIHMIKFNRRKHYKKTQGHRQKYTTIKIINISNNLGI